MKACYNYRINYCYHCLSLTFDNVLFNTSTDHWIIAMTQTRTLYKQINWRVLEVTEPFFNQGILKI